jgi:DNA-binding MarR family transcriptional regulator
MPTRPLSRLQVAGHLLGSLNRLQRAWDARWRQVCDEAGVHPSQAQALLYLAEHGPMPMQELSRGLYIAPSTGTRIIEQMEKVRWVTRSPDHEDRRRVLLQLRAEGEELAWELQSLGQALLWRNAGDGVDAEPLIGALDRLTGRLGGDR